MPDVWSEGGGGEDLVGGVGEGAKESEREVSGGGVRSAGRNACALADRGSRSRAYSRRFRKLSVSGSASQAAREVEESAEAVKTVETYW